MADYYMKITVDGSEIKGESGDEKHSEWIGVFFIPT